MTKPPMRNVPRALRMRLCETLSAYGHTNLNQYAGTVLDALLATEHEFWLEMRSMPPVTGCIGTITTFQRPDGVEFSFMCAGSDGRQAAANEFANVLTNGEVVRLCAGDRYIYVRQPNGYETVHEITQRVRVVVPK